MGAIVMKTNLIGISGKIKSGKDTVSDMIQYLSSDIDLAKTEPLKAFNIFKNTLSNEYHNTWEIKKFATKLKEIVSIILGCSLEDLENQQYKSLTLTEATGQDWSKWYIHHDGKMPYSDVAYDAYYSTKTEALKYYNPQVDAYPEKIELTVRDLLQMTGTEFGRRIIHPDTWVLSLFSEYKKDSKWIITDLRFNNEAEAIKKRGGVLIRVNRPFKYRYPNVWEKFIKDNNTKEYTEKEVIKWLSNKKEYNKLYRSLTHVSETELDNYDKFDYTINSNNCLKKLLFETEIIYSKL